ncbi:MAG: hypothetical protein M1840_004261 [Geoglossum simile]|nr:MAG: hypothetical protein M1840_004261 [Geoglossum simile]
MVTTSRLSSGPPTPEGWAKDRRFRPDKLYGEDIDPDLVEIRRDGVWTFVACPVDGPCRNCGKLTPHVDCIIIAVDGACRGNGTVEARATVGVFVGSKSKYNVSFALNTARPTNQVAELTAAIFGLQQASVIQSNKVGRSELGNVVIKADSEYLVKGMTDWVFKWEQNGYITAKGKPVTNVSLFKELVRLVTELNERGVEVLFWHVPRERNQEADALANAAFSDD